MAWDIYGNPLRVGYCEVHPDVHEPWPCSQCQYDAAEADAQRRAYEKYMREQEAAYYAASHQPTGPDAHP